MVSTKPCHINMDAKVDMIMSTVPLIFVFISPDWVFALDTQSFGGGTAECSDDV